MSGSGRRLRALGKATLGVVVGLALAEIAFHVRDHGAFPHLNTYVADPVLGVRMKPVATERVAFGGNPVTHVRINASGFRGADWPAPAGDEILVVGDSQAFGLGVEETDTFSAGLATALRKPVLNAAVPTWGPPEYEKIIDELTAKRPAKTVLYVVPWLPPWQRRCAPPRPRRRPGRACRCRSVARGYRVPSSGPRAVSWRSKALPRRAA